MLKPLDWKEFRASEWSAHALAGAIAYHIRKMRDGRFAITIAGMHYPAVPTLEKAQAYCQEDLFLRIKHHLAQDYLDLARSASRIRRRYEALRQPPHFITEDGTASTDINIFGCGYRFAAKAHTCWLCGETIPKNTGYFRTAGTLDGKIFSVKHCRTTCEYASDLLDQNLHLAPAVFHRTFAAWEHA